MTHMLIFFLIILLVFIYNTNGAKVNRANLPHDHLTITRIMEMAKIVGNAAVGSLTLSPTVHFHFPNTILNHSDDSDHHWNEYMALHNKKYSNLQENRRKQTWLENIIRIYKHNAEALQGKHSFFLGLNPFADLDAKEYLRKHVKLKKSRRGRAENVDMLQGKRDVNIPEEFSWVDEGFHTPNWDQEDCGSCYAFSIAVSAEGQYFRKTKKVVNLSAQQLVDCSITTGNRGCNGGSLKNTLRYCLRAKGLTTEENYPYEGKQKYCRYTPNSQSVNVSSYIILPEGDEKAIEKTVATVGPVACSINASPYTFQLYRGGIYDDHVCSSNHVNHAMVIVGYTKNAWILKNWWGPHWGLGGYMLLKKGSNRCAIANYAAYPIVDDVPLYETLLHF